MSKCTTSFDAANFTLPHSHNDIIVMLGYHSAVLYVRKSFMSFDTVLVC